MDIPRETLGIPIKCKMQQNEIEGIDSTLFGKFHIFWEGHNFLRNLHLSLDLSYVVMVKSTVEISQNFAAFSEYINFICQLLQSEFCQRSILQ